MTIEKRLQEHYQEALEYFPEDRIVGIFLQGSQNYKLDTEFSDVDTKLIVIPTFEEIVFNKKLHSTTHIRKNDEHIDFKDIRLMLGTFRKQNLNFLEILFTDYKIINPLYGTEWQKLISNNEAIVRYNPIQSIKSMKGIAMEKFHAMEHLYPSKIDTVTKFGYDPKQLHHLLRVEEYIKRYIAGEKYSDCLISQKADFLINVKLGNIYSLEEARVVGKNSLDQVVKMHDDFVSTCSKVPNEKVDAILDEVQYNIMKIAIQKEI